MSEVKYKDGAYALLSNNDPVCPHCGKEQEHEHYFESVSYEDDETVSLNCGFCRKLFKCHTSHVPKFTTYVKSIDGDEDED